MINIHSELISGLVFGAEMVDGQEIQDEDEDAAFFISIDLLFFRLVIEIPKE